MATIDWPTSLADRNPLRPNHSGTPQDQTLRSTMDAGAPKARRRFTAGTTILKMSYHFSSAEFLIFESFFDDTLAAGSLRFNFVDPRTETTVEARIEKPYTFVAAEEPDHWTIFFDLRIWA